MGGLQDNKAFKQAQKDAVREEKRRRSAAKLEKRRRKAVSRIQRCWRHHDFRVRFWGFVREKRAVTKLQVHQGAL